MAKEYSAGSLTVLQGLEAVRKRPGMYIGSTSTRGLHHLVYEIIDNAVDEHLAGFCKTINVTLNEDGSVSVEDDGRGVPVDLHPTEKTSDGKPMVGERVVYTLLHAGGKFSDKTYKISGGLHGVGSAVVNALSKKLLVEVYRNGYVHYDSYAYGNPTTKLEGGYLPKKKLKEKKVGTKVTIYPDETIFKETVKFKADTIRQRLRDTSYLNPDLTLNFLNVRDKKELEVFHEPGGLKAFVTDVASDYTKYTDVISISGEKDGIAVDISFVMTEDAEECVYGFTNSISNSDGGTHITGFKSSFAALINSYARNELGLLKEKDQNLNGTETRSGLIGVVSVKVPEPLFEGQTKTKLSNSEANTAVSAVVKESLTVFFDRNLEILRNICDRAVALSKQKSLEKSKVNINKFSFEDSGKIAKQESSDTSKTELFIVEGDSAGGSAKNARDRKYQAILPLRGKILNCEKISIDKLFANAEIRSLISAFGCGIQDSFDITKLAYDKIIIMTDADVDGAHIAILMLTFLFRFYPDLIREGHVYLATPPLYKCGDGKKAKYLYSEEEMEKYRKSHKKGYSVQRYKGLGEMDAEQLWETTMGPDRVLRKITLDDLWSANHYTTILMGNDVAPRRKYIEEHGKEANID